MIEYLILLASIPLGVLLANLTEYEKEIYSNLPYFPLLLPLLAVLAILSVALNFDKQIIFSLIFMAITVFVWYKI